MFTYIVIVLRTNITRISAQNLTEKNNLSSLLNLIYPSVYNTTSGVFPPPILTIVLLFMLHFV